MTIAHKTKFYHSDMTDAPAMTTAAGGIINVLDACLINGFNSKALTSLVVSGGVATATVSSGHGLSQFVVIKIAGATPSGLNGEHRVATVASSTTFTFDATGISNGTATGSITLIVAGAGWTKAFSGTNKAAYNSATSFSGAYFSIDDSGVYTVGSPVRGYDAMTDIDTGTRPFPTVAQQTNFATRRSQDASGNRSWLLIADDKFFYLFTRLQSATERGYGICFGDICSFDPSDTSACIIAASNTANPIASSFTFLYSVNNISGQKYLSSAYDEYANGSVSAGIYSAQIESSFLSFSASNYPANTNNNSGISLLRSGVVCEKTESANAVRGMMPAYYTALVKKDNFITSGWFNIAQINGLPFILLNTIGSGTNDNLVAFDLGGWR